MGFRVGKRVGNTYVSTNGRNVRTTTKIGKNTYYTHQYGHSRKRSSRNRRRASLYGSGVILGFLMAFGCMIMCYLSFVGWLCDDTSFSTVVWWLVGSVLSPLFACCLLD